MSQSELTVANAFVRICNSITKIQADVASSKIDATTMELLQHTADRAKRALNALQTKGSAKYSAEAQDHKEFRTLVEGVVQDVAIDDTF